MEAMTRERLEQYQSNKAEIKELTAKLKKLGTWEDESTIVSSVILDCRKGYPQPRTIIGRDTALEAKYRKRIEDQIAKLQTEQDNIEEWIFGIKDGLTRRVFRLHYMEGVSQTRIARIIHIDQSRVSRKIDNYLKNA